MLIIQHIWTRWTQATRGVEAGRQKRPRPDEAYPLPEVPPEVPGTSRIFRHEIALIEQWPEFERIDRWGEIGADDWQRPAPHRETLWTWRVRGEDVEVRMHRPRRLQTKFPRVLPSPLFVLRPGDVARIDWNGRLATSLFGSKRSTYYEQQICWIANVSAAGPRLFLGATPRKHIDLRTEIY
jgi:hypothetical protein